MRPILIAALLTAGAAPAFGQETTDPRKAEILGKLNGSRITLDFKDTPLEDAVGFLRDYTQINFHVDPDLRTKFSDEQLRITLKVRDLLLKSALKLMLSAKELTAVYREGVLIIQHREKTAGATTLQVYDVRDLLIKLQDFPGPKVELTQGSGGGAPLTGATFSLEEPRSVITEDFITDMVKSNTGDRSWEENPKASISLANGLLVVTQTKKIHEEIQRLLNLLRQFK